MEFPGLSSPQTGSDIICYLDVKKCSSAGKQSLCASITNAQRNTVQRRGRGREELKNECGVGGVGGSGVCGGKEGRE